MNAPRPSSVTLLPGSLLPYRDSYEEFARRLPPGTVLICIPTADTPQQKALLKTAVLFEAAGRRPVTVVSTARFTSRTDTGRYDEPQSEKGHPAALGSGD